MIQIWISRGTLLPVREQLSAQLLLGILSRRIAPGERLPSVRELARRLKVHANTVSTVYQDLAKRGWVESIHGSGVFARNIGEGEQTEGPEAFVRAWVEDGRARGFSLATLQTELAKLASHTEPDRFLVVDTDGELAAIIAAELSEATAVMLESASCNDDRLSTIEQSTCLLANVGHIPALRSLLPGRTLHPVHLVSMQDAIEGQKRPSGPVMIGVVSRSPSVLSWAGRLLGALGFDEESVLLRDACNPGWIDGLRACDLLATDVLCDPLFPADLPHRAFRVVAEHSLAEIRALVTGQKL